MDGGDKIEEHEPSHLFIELHGFASPGELSDALKHNAKLTYGAPMRRFLEKIIEDRDVAVSKVREGMKKSMDKNMPVGAGGQVQRALNKFALIAATGELAIELGIFPYERGETRKSARLWFNIWLEQRNGTEDAEILAALSTLKKHFDSCKGQYMLRDWVETDPLAKQPREIAGYKYEANGKWTFFVLGATLDKLIHRVNRKAIIRKLDKMGCIEKTSNDTIKTHLSIRGENARGVGIVIDKLP